jgi:hypothetical protein
MSDNTDDTNNPDTTDDTGDAGDDSLWSNLKNKVAYKIHNAATDPNANKFATEKAKRDKEEKEKKRKSISETKSDTTDDTTNDPNQFSAKRLAKKVGNQTLDILKKIAFPFIALMLAMIVANDAIVYSVPIRIIFFIFTFFICYYAKPLCIILGIFYILKGGYSYYVNHMTDRPKQEIMPTIYALLPITTYKPMSSLGAFLLYPFTYPKTDEAAVQLPKTMESYWDDLEDSFKDINKVKNLPLFVNEIKQIQKDLSELHNPKGQLMTFGGKEETIPNNTKQEATQQTKNIKLETSQNTNNTQKPVNKPANTNKPENAPQIPVTSSNIKGTINNTMKVAAVTGQLLKINQLASNKPANGEQPVNKPSNGEQTNKAANGEQTNKPANGEQPVNKPSNGEQTNKAANGEQTNKPANGEQTNKPANVEQPVNKPVNKISNKAENGVKVLSPPNSPQLLVPPNSPE